MDRDWQISALKKIIWEYKLTAEELLPLLNGEVDNVKGMKRKELFIKILNNFYWHKVRTIIPSDLLPYALSDDVVGGVFPRDLRDKYRYVRELL